MASMRMLRSMSSARKSASPEKGAGGGELSRNEGIILARQTHILWSLFRIVGSHVGTPRSVLPSDPDSPMSPSTPHAMPLRNQKVGSTYGDC